MYAALWIVPGVAAMAMLVYVIKRLELVRKYRRWNYWRKFKPQQSMRGALSVFHEIVQPEVRYVEEEQRQRHSEVDQNDPSQK